MLSRRLVVWMFLVGIMVLGAGVVSGQSYPNKPIRIVTAEPGSGNDLVRDWPRKEFQAPWVSKC